MDRKSFKAVITFRFCNAVTGEIIYELIKEYDLYYKKDRFFLYEKLDNFLDKVIKDGQVCSYSLEFINKPSSQYKELPLQF